MNVLLESLIIELSEGLENTMYIIVSSYINVIDRFTGSFTELIPCLTNRHVVKRSALFILDYITSLSYTEGHNKDFCSFIKKAVDVV